MRGSRRPRSRAVIAGSEEEAPPVIPVLGWEDPLRGERRAYRPALLRRAVAAVIVATRRDQDITQHELARRLGWSRDKLGKTEAGLRRVELGDVVMIAQALGEKAERVIHRILTWNG